MLQHPNRYRRYGRTIPKLIRAARSRSSASTNDRLSVLNPERPGIITNFFFMTSVGQRLDNLQPMPMRRFVNVPPNVLGSNIASRRIIRECVGSNRWLTALEIKRGQLCAFGKCIVRNVRETLRKHHRPQKPTGRERPFSNRLNA